MPPKPSPKAAAAKAREKELELRRKNAQIRSLEKQIRELKAKVPVDEEESDTGSSSSSSLVPPVPAAKVAPKAAPKQGKKRKRDDPSLLFPHLSSRAVDKLVVAYEDYPSMFDLLDAGARGELAGATGEGEVYEILDRLAAENYGHQEKERSEDRLLEPETWPDVVTPGWLFEFNSAVERAYPFAGNAALKERRTRVIQDIRDHWELRAPKNKVVWIRRAQGILNELEAAWAEYTERDPRAGVHMRRLLKMEDCSERVLGNRRRFRADFRRRPQGREDPGRVRASKTPVCRSFARGKCGFKDCKYLHEKQ
ncbi:hypothetical protein DIPPA_07652 [Diplonema papillatum]|nr:hypothetical protein DIPPA_07652 [Diplonema papillatum]